MSLIRHLFNACCAPGTLLDIEIKNHTQGKYNPYLFGRNRNRGTNISLESLQIVILTTLKEKNNFRRKRNLLEIGGSPKTFSGVVTSEL